MGDVLWALSYAAYGLFAVVSVLCLASGLYYLAELVEEYIILTQRIIRRCLQVGGKGRRHELTWTRLLSAFMCSF
jgi:hypothetical protein